MHTRLDSHVTPTHAGSAKTRASDAFRFTGTNGKISSQQRTNAKSSILVVLQRARRAASAFVTPRDVFGVRH